MVCIFNTTASSLLPYHFRERGQPILGDSVNTTATPVQPHSCSSQSSIIYLSCDRTTCTRRKESSTFYSKHITNIHTLHNLLLKGPPPPFFFVANSSCHANQQIKSSNSRDTLSRHCICCLLHRNFDHLCPKSYIFGNQRLPSASKLPARDGRLLTAVILLYFFFILIIRARKRYNH